MHHLIGLPGLHPRLHQPEKPGVLHFLLQPELRVHHPDLLLLLWQPVQVVLDLHLPQLLPLPQVRDLLPQAPQPPIQNFLHPSVKVRLIPPPDQLLKVLLPPPGVGSRTARVCSGLRRVLRPGQLPQPLRCFLHICSFPW